MIQLRFFLDDRGKYLCVVSNWLPVKLETSWCTDVVSLS